VPVTPVNETDMVLLPQGLKALKQMAKEVGLDLRGAYLNLDGGFDSAHNRKCMFNAGMIPNMKENPRNELVASFVNRSNPLKSWEKNRHRRGQCLRSVQAKKRGDHVHSGLIRCHGSPPFF